MQKYFSYSTYTYFKGFVTGLLFFYVGLTAVGQSVSFADTVFSKRLNSLNLNIELPYNETVGKNIHLFTHQGTALTARALGIFLEEKEYLDSALKAAELPQELHYLPFALMLTNFNGGNRAGIWQLPHFVAVKYGLTITNEVDERLDVKKSTVAAVAFLQNLSEKYNDLWDIIIAYSNSVSALKSAKIRANQQADIWNLYENGKLPHKNIIPDFITGIYLANFYQSHQIKPVTPEKNADNSIVIPPKPVVSQTKPNPSNTNQKNVVPVKKEDAKKITYIVKSGDTLTKIAKKYGVTIANIQKWNNLKSDRINIGQKLIINLL